MKWPKIFKKSEEIQKEKYTASSLRMPIDFAIPMVGDIYNIPILAFPLKMLYDVSHQSSVVDTIVRAITDEVFRNGIIIQPRFKSKCTKCGAEYEDDVPICEECGGITRSPDLTERKKMKQWIEDFRNSFNESLITVLKQIDDDINRVDNGFILLRKDYYYTEDGKFFGFKVKDIIRASPFKMRLMMSKYGIGRGMQGEYLYVCPEHREELIRKEKSGTYYCDKCGKELLPAWYASADKGRILYYAKDEVYHIKRWSQTQGYGIPPILSVIIKVLLLMKMDRYMLAAYSLQRSPKGLLILRGRIDSIERAWEQLKQKAMENPNMIYPLVIEGASDDSGKRVVEWVDFGLKPDEMEWTEVRNEMRKQIGARFGVMPLFQGDLSIGGGLNNEGLQITVTNRTIETSQTVWNAVLDWLSKQLGYSDWKFELAPNEEKDLKAEIERERMRIENARIMKDLGYEPVLVEGLDGIDFTYKKSSSSGSSAPNIRSIRAILHDESTRNPENEIEGSPEGRGKRAYTQGYEGSIGKGYTENKVKVRVVRNDGVQQTYYVSRDKLRSFIAQHEANGQTVVVEGLGEVSANNIGAEILTEVMPEIMSQADNPDEIISLLHERGVDDKTALGIATFAYMVRTNHNLLSAIISDFHGQPVVRNDKFDELRGIVTDDIIEMWEKVMSHFFEKQFGNAILSAPIEGNILVRLNLQQRSGSDKYIHDRSVLQMQIGQISNSIQTKPANNILFFADGKVLIDCSDVKFSVAKQSPPSESE